MLRDIDSRGAQPTNIDVCQKLFDDYQRIENLLMENGKLTTDQNKIDTVMKELELFHKNHPEIDRCGDD